MNDKHLRWLEKNEPARARLARRLRTYLNHLEGAVDRARDARLPWLAASERKLLASEEGTLPSALWAIEENEPTDPEVKA